MTDLETAIEWLEWGPAAFAQAMREGRPILLSLVAPWCEHCVLMDRTVYSLGDVTRLIDRSFVPVRVDTDRRPDINERYNLGGWPTTAFLTPGGEILGGGTFIDAGQMPATLLNVAEAFVRRRAEIDARIGAKPLSFAPQSPQTGHVSISDVAVADSVEWVSAQLLERFDSEYGGFGEAAKFPHVAALMLMLERFGETGDSRYERVVTKSLDALARLYDEVDGGFFRYASRRDWSGPHTEKMLSDNASLLRLYLEAGTLLERPDYVARAKSALEWVHKTLADRDHGGFSGSVAAQAEYYRADMAARRVVPMPPPIDQTHYADSNAAMISTYFRAAEVIGESWLREFAVKSVEQAVLGGYQPGGGVAHITAPDPGVRGLLADQIAMIDALVRAHAATGQLPYSMLAAELMDYALHSMWDESLGRFRDRAIADSDVLGLLNRPLYPFVVNCEAAQMLSRLDTISGRVSYRKHAETILANLSGEYRDDPLSGASYVLAVREVREGRLPPGLSLSFVDWRLNEPDED